MSDIKLTVKQKEVLRRMREGGVLVSNVWSGWYFKGDDKNKVHNSTACGLRYKGLIICTKESIPENFYVLTELGKTIEL